jgi:pimeloyl-ACP methyl ester carboxylesterase
VTSRSDVVPAQAGIQFLEIAAGRIECLDIPATRDAPPILMLHEGLGCISMWRDFPLTLAQATGSRVVAYSRLGFGRSSPRASPYSPIFIHEEANDTIPVLREHFGLANPVLLGHSTGASMALVHAGAGRWPVAGIVAMAPLTTVEGSNVASIKSARTLYETTAWREKLARHHDDVDAVFYGWNDTWLREDFRRWNILDDLRRVRSPVLAILGESDEYSSPAQVAAIAECMPRPARFEALLLEACGHAPHRDQPDAVIAAVGKFLLAV